MNTKGRWVWPYFLPFAVIGALALLWLTPRGPGVSPDSTVYLAGAQSLLAGKGFAIDGAPITHFPPFYSACLALVALFVRGDVLGAARLFGALLLALNLVLIGWLAYLASGRRYWVGALATVFGMTAEPLFELHAWAWSEPLFVALVLASILTLVAYIGRPRLAPLILSGAAMGLALITRYIGIGFLPAGVLVIYLARPRRDRLLGIQSGLTWLGLACLPLLLVFLRNVVVTGAITDRGLAVHPAPVVDSALMLASTLSRLVALDPWVARLGAAAILLILVYLVFPFESWRVHLSDVDRRSPEFAIPFSGLVACAAYLVFLYISLSFLDASTPLDARILAPVLVLMIITGFPAVRTLGERLNKPAAWLALVVVIAILMIARLPAIVPVLSAIQRDGLGYTSRAWTDSPTVRYARTLPAGGRLFSNAPDAIRFLAGRPATRLPATASQMSLVPNSEYRQQIDQFCRAIAGGGAYLVYFNSVQPWNLPGIAALRSKCEVPLLTQLGDGAIYGRP